MPNKGERVRGEWVLDELLGEGAFGQVFRAHAQSDPRKLAAVKIPRDDRGAALLRTESAAQSRLVSPHIPRVLGVSEDPPYIAFEYVLGESLRSALLGGRIEAPRSHRIAHAVLSALHEAHEKGVVHRDVKPENILLAADGRTLVTDFGLSAPVEVEQSLADADPALVGSIPYMAPELRGGGPADARADLYAFGVVLFELVTGALPGAAEVPSSLGQNRDWDAFYKKLVARRDERYQTAAEALASLPKPRPGSPQPAPRAKVDVKALLDRVAGEEREFMQKDFMAYVTPQGKAHARVAGKTYTFDVAAPAGLAVLHATGPTTAVVVRRFSRA